MILLDIMHKCDCTHRHQTRNVAFLKITPVRLHTQAIHKKCCVLEDSALVWCFWNTNLLPEMQAHNRSAYVHVYVCMHLDRRNFSHKLTFTDTNHVTIVSSAHTLRSECDPSNPRHWMMSCTTHLLPKHNKSDASILHTTSSKPGMD